MKGLQEAINLGFSMIHVSFALFLISFMEDLLMVLSTLLCLLIYGRPLGHSDPPSQIHIFGRKADFRI